jgi:hypothetical protein
MANLTPEDLGQLFSLLPLNELDLVVVGGQAVNLWAYQYQQQAPQLQEYQPFASEDLDFYGGRVEAAVCHQVLGGQLFLNRDFDPSPNAGVLLLDYQDKKLRIDFLASVYGLNDAEIAATSLTFLGKAPLAGVQLKVLHPLLCLEGKLRCLRGLPQGGRQDLKHVRMSLLCLQAFLHGQIEQTTARFGLKLIERMMTDAQKEDGLSAWYHYGLEIESAIPLNTLRSLSDEQWQRFWQLRWPQVEEQLTLKRQRYRQIALRLEHPNLTNEVEMG